MTKDLVVDQDALREQVRVKYREVAADPTASFHFHTGRGLARACLPKIAVDHADDR
jgi:arsenite methyltransferase